LSCSRSSRTSVSRYVIERIELAKIRRAVGNEHEATIARVIGRAELEEFSQFSGITNGSYDAGVRDATHGARFDDFSDNGILAAGLLEGATSVIHHRCSSRRRLAIRFHLRHDRRMAMSTSCEDPAKIVTERNCEDMVKPSWADRSHGIHREFERTGVTFTAHHLKISGSKRALIFASRSHRHEESAS
jgi:hypothetical protein